MNEKILKKIKMIREERGLSIIEMANILGYESTKGYYDVESGRVKLRIEHLERLSKYLKIPIEKFFSY